MTWPALEAWFRIFSWVIGRRAAGNKGDEVGGKRKGRLPVGEAWFEEGVTVKGMPVMRSAVWSRVY